MCVYYGRCTAFSYVRRNEIQCIMGVVPSLFVISTHVSGSSHIRVFVIVTRFICDEFT